MKIWVIGRGYPTRSNNMLGSFELEQAKMLQKYGNSVSYFVEDIHSLRRLRRFGYYCRREDGVNIAIANIPWGGLIPVAELKDRYNKTLKTNLRKTEDREGRPDIIHVHYPSFIPFDIVADYQNKGVRIVATEHWSGIQKKTLMPKQLKNLHDFVKYADAMCCVSSLIKKSIVELTKTDRAIEIVPNVVNNVFKPIKEKHSEFRFVATGRLIPLKQFDKIVEAFLDVFGNNDNVTLTIAGNGEEFDKINRIIAQRNAKQQVRLLGSISREEMAFLIASSDALVSFSILETFCVPLIEAWACGKPVIGTQSTGVFFENSDKRLGIMVDYQNIDTLKNAFMNIYENKSSYSSEWITNYAIQHFSEEVVYNRLFSIYESQPKDTNNL